MGNIVSSEKFLAWVDATLAPESSPKLGPSYLLPNGKFIFSSRLQAQFDPCHPSLILRASLAFNFMDIKIDPYINFGCIRLNNGVHSIGDSYICLPNQQLTEAQYLGLEKWLYLSTKVLRKLTISYNNDSKILLEHISITQEKIPEIIKIIKTLYK